MNKEIVDAINKTPHKAFIAICGGGQNFIGDFLAFEGASNTILGCYVPYDKQLFNEFVQGKPDNYASPEAARKLAVASYLKAVKLVGKDFAIGIGAASSVASLNEREGRQHRINVAIQTNRYTKWESYTLNQGRSREEENNFVTNLILENLALTCGIAPLYLAKPSLNKQESYDFGDSYPNEQIRELVHGERNYVSSDDILKNKKVVLFCGSFNPFHLAHSRITEIAEKFTGFKPYIELSVGNTDKPFMDYCEIENRANALRKLGQKVLLTNAPRYVDKVNALNLSQDSEIVFVVGADTWVRIWDEKYGIDLGTLIDTFIKRNVKFLVFPRNGQRMENYKDNLTFTAWNKHIEALVLPCSEADAFNFSMSSSEIRKTIHPVN